MVSGREILAYVVASTWECVTTKIASIYLRV